MIGLGGIAHSGGQGKTVGPAPFFKKERSRFLHFCLSAQRPDEKKCDEDHLTAGTHKSNDCESRIVGHLEASPAIFAITREPLIIYTLNVFAILSLRAMHCLLAGASARFHLLRYGLALILIFVGLKHVLAQRGFGRGISQAQYPSV